MTGGLERLTKKRGGKNRIGKSLFLFSKLIVEMVKTTFNFYVAVFSDINEKYVNDDKNTDY